MYPTNGGSTLLRKVGDYLAVEISEYPILLISINTQALPLTSRHNINYTGMVPTT